MKNGERRSDDIGRDRCGNRVGVQVLFLLMVAVMIPGGPGVCLGGQHCGAEGDWRNVLIPDQWPPPETKKRFSTALGDIKTVPVYKACIGHDNCYGTPGADRDVCDRQFLEDMKTECDRVYDGILDIPLREACHLAARGYYQAVKKHGRQAFQKAQGKLQQPVASASLSDPPAEKAAPAEIPKKTTVASQEEAPPPADDRHDNSGAEAVASTGVSGGSATDVPGPDTSNPRETRVVTGPVFFNSDFESGDLTNWTPTGEAFQYQPTRGDNPTARNRNQPSRHQGDFWIGSFEKYRGKPDEKPGSRQGDTPTGTLCSIPFQINGTKIGFLIGGGMRIDDLTVVLKVEDREVRKATGQNSETMERIIWDVEEFQGKAAQIIIQDSSSKGWGHINVDDFRFM